MKILPAYLFLAVVSVTVVHRSPTPDHAAVDPTGADYAEWLPRLDRSESIAPGDVVGVFGGRISRRTRWAEALLVVSTRPCVVGNAVDGRARRSGHEAVAFLGQVPVRVRGPVDVGDLLLPSGRQDGTAIAVAPEDLAPGRIGQVVGRAWESARGRGVQLVTASVGLERGTVTQLAMESMRAELDEVHALLRRAMAGRE